MAYCVPCNEPQRLGWARSGRFPKSASKIGVPAFRLMPQIVPVVFLILPEPGGEIEERQLPAYSPAPDMANIEDATHITELDTRMEPEVEPSAEVHECYRASEALDSAVSFSPIIWRDFTRSRPRTGALWF